MSNLVGQKVKLKITEHDYRGTIYKSYEIDDPVMEKKIKDAHPGCRIFPPGTCGTADWKPFRLNVHIDESGTITGTDLG